jgi:hypothetical protein
MIRAHLISLLLLSACAEATAPGTGGGGTNQVVPFAVPDAWCPTGSDSSAAKVPDGCKPPKAAPSRAPGPAESTWVKPRTETTRSSALPSVWASAGAQGWRR